MAFLHSSLSSREDNLGGGTSTSGTDLTGEGDSRAEHTTQCEGEHTRTHGSV